MDLFGKTDQRGTKITFHPDENIFAITELSFEKLSQRLRQLSYLNSGLTITIQDERSDKEHVFSYSGGIASFVEDLTKHKTRIHQDVIAFSDEKTGTVVDIALQWDDGFAENTYCFTNNIYNKDGGSHLTGFRQALTRTINTYGTGQGILKNLNEL